MSTRLHEKIRILLETTPGLTQRGLADVMGLDPAAVNRMLYGRRGIQAEEIPVIEAYLGQALDLAPSRGVSDVRQQQMPLEYKCSIFIGQSTNINKNINSLKMLR